MRIHCGLLQTQIDLCLYSKRFSKYNRRVWESADKDRLYLEMGDVFVAVTPVRNWLLLCNTEALISLFQGGQLSPKQLCGISFACAS